MGKNTKGIIYAITAAALLLPFQNCGQSVDFEKALASSVVSYVQEGENLKVQESFSSPVNKGQGKVDLIWVVDNSGSMNEEAEHVRNNLYNFLDQIVSNSDVKFKLVSSKGTAKTNTTIPFEETEQFSQINQPVGSTNGLLIVKGLIENGYLDDFFRPNALKYIVMVTDDDSTMLSAKDFLKFMTDTFPGEKLKVSSFTGLGKSISPCQYNTGTQYMELEQLTSGHTFNICDLDWSQNFDKLASNVSFSANNTFELTVEDIISIDSVMINGNEIDLNKVDLNGTSITINFDINQYASEDVLNFVVKYTTLATSSPRGD